MPKPVENPQKIKSQEIRQNKTIELSEFEKVAKQTLQDIITKAFLEKKNLGFFQKLRGLQITGTINNETGERTPFKTLNTLKLDIANEAEKNGKDHLSISPNLWKSLEKDSRSQQPSYIFEQLKTLLDAGMVFNKEEIGKNEYASRYDDQFGGGRVMMKKVLPGREYERGDLSLSFDEFCSVCRDQFKAKGDKEALKLLESCEKTINNQQSLFAQSSQSSDLSERNKRLAASQVEKQSKQESNPQNESSSVRNEWRNKVSSQQQGVSSQQSENSQTRGG